MMSAGGWREHDSDETKSKPSTAGVLRLRLPSHDRTSESVTWPSI